MTSTGLVVIPLALVIIILPWRHSFPALLIFALLGDAAVVNIGAFGLQPGYFFALLIIGRTLVEILLLRHPLNRDVLIAVFPLFLLVIVSVSTLWIALTFFQARIMVMPGSAGFKLDLAQPYSLVRENFTQLFYLCLNTVLAYSVAHQAARFLGGESIRVADRAIVISLLFAVGVAMWEMANFYGGIPFPSGFFHSNAGYAHAEGQTLHGILRVSGSSSEPSGLAYALTGYLYFAWYRYFTTPTAFSMSLIVLCVFVMMMTTSTTAYLSLAIFCVVAGKDVVLGFARRADKGLHVTTSAGASSLVLLIGLIGGALFAASNRDNIDLILTSMVFEKTKTGSYVQRVGADMMAVDIAIDTGGIGVGLGSHKANNLGLTILSNTGVAGFCIFAAFAFSLLRPRRFAIRADVCAGNFRPIRWFAIGLLLGHAISNPVLSVLLLWSAFGLAAGGLSAMQAVWPAGCVAPPARHALRHRLPA